MLNAKELDTILEKSIAIIDKHVDNAKDATLYAEDIRDISEATAVILSVAYARLKDEPK